MHEKGLRFSSDIQWVTQPWHSKPDPQLDALLGARCVPKEWRGGCRALTLASFAL